jgi:excisionase family DNA binding protein
MSANASTATPQLGDVVAVAAVLNCSTKTVRRMVDAGRIPGVLRLGRLLRFDLTILSQWIQQGCPPVHRFRPGPPAGATMAQSK